MVHIEVEGTVEHFDETGFLEERTGNRRRASKQVYLGQDERAGKGRWNNCGHTEDWSVRHPPSCQVFQDGFLSVQREAIPALKKVRWVRDSADEVPLPACDILSRSK